MRSGIRLRFVDFFKDKIFWILFLLKNIETDHSRFVQAGSCTLSGSLNEFFSILSLDVNVNVNHKHGIPPGSFTNFITT